MASMASLASVVGRGAGMVVRRVLLYPAVALGTVGAAVGEMRSRLPDVDVGGGLGALADGGKRAGPRARAATATR